MKKLYTLLLLAIPALSFGQIGIHLESDTFKSCYTNQDVELDFYVINLDSNSQAKTLRWRLMNDFSGTATSNWSNYICQGDILAGGQCYSSHTRAIDFISPLGYMDSTLMQSHIMVTTDTGLNTSVLVVFDPNDSANTVVEVRFTAHATLDPAGIEDVDLDAVLSQNAPNPFSNSTVINYDIVNRGSLKIQDLTGKLIREIALNSGSGKITVSDLNAGIYFYSLFDGNQMLGTKRMQVVN